MRRMCGVLLGLFVAGCVSAPPVDMQAHYANLPEMPDDVFPPISIGQTVATSPMNTLYHFKGSPGDKVTITARSHGASLNLSLLHTANVHSPDFNNPMIAQDMEKAASLSLFDINGPHAEMLVTLPEDADGIYVIQLWPQHGVRSLMLSTGHMPAEDIVQLNRPRNDNRGKFMFPLKADDSLAGWAMKSAEISRGTSIGNTAGRALGKVSGGLSSQGLGLAGIAGAAVGHATAINSIGGWGFIQQSSDLSFDSLTDMARYLHYRYADHPQYGLVLGAASSVYYPDFGNAMTQVMAGR